MTTTSTFTYFFIIATLIYLPINLWVGIRGWQSIGRNIPLLNAKIYWLIFWLTALSYPVSRFGREVLPPEVTGPLTLVGSFWLGAVIYFILALLVIDGIRLLDRLFGFLPRRYFQGPAVAMVTGLTVVVLVAGVFAYGWWNARHPVLTRYSVTIPKQAGELKELRLVAVSDLHLGYIVNRARLDQMVDMVNGLEPDLVLLPGDVIDETPAPFVEQEMASSFRRLAPQYGVYAAPGNHEYIGRRFDEIVKHLQEAGIQVLVDSTVKIAGSFYIVGRNDPTGQRFTAHKRMELEELLKGLDPSLPVFLMDHQPSRKGSGDEQGADLKISGHTHRGQFFPFNLITGKMYETDWGYLKRGELNAVVTSGYGTFGPPIRVGNRPEVVLIDIQFGSGL